MEAYIVAFTTFFATIGPLDVVAIYVGITPNMTPKARRRMAMRGILISTIILLFFAFIGEFVLNYLGISLAALKVSGGILLLLIAIDLVFARSSGSVSTTDEEEEEAIDRQDVSVFPLATPLIAGPGAMGSVILLMADTNGDFWQGLLVIGAMLTVLLITLVLLLLSNPVQHLFGLTGMQVVSRVFGVILAALAVQFLFDGIIQSGILSGASAFAGL